MDWACSRFVVPTPRDSCRASFPRTSRSSAIGASTLAGLHNPQGRVIALLALLRTAPRTKYSPCLPRELVGAVEPRLRKYILRAKVRIEDLGESIRVLGLGEPVAAACGLHQLPWGDRWMLLVPADSRSEFVDGRNDARTTGNAPTSPRACRRSTGRPAKPSWRRCSISTC